MIRRFTYIFLLLTGAVFTVAPVTCYAQDTDDSMVVEKDSIEAMLDSLSGYPPDSDYNGAEQDTLFFSGKEDPSSLYDSSVIKSRFVPDSVTQALKADKAFWYANKDMQTQKKKTGSHSFWYKLWDIVFTMLRSPVFRQLMWLLMLILFSAAVIWFLVQNKMNIFGSRKPVALSPQLKEGDADNIFAANLQEAVAAAAAEGNYRLAVRFSYLHLLKIFSQNDLIHYTTGATNSEYLARLYTKPFYKDFFQVTRSYEYAWYGEMPVSREQYENIQHDFSSLYQKAGISI
ncbi:DUF4129 domain-containing protein [Agriterribacter sp.]|uniref:DUF4129 domain-containing protein n=1 Tax=Agriterribacter sp. TaxID=2821509 RepID=UPI002CA73B48|nr:DUF4129 domain-containing protein [Agriterribacter sp.]HRO47198.1 DUF4129 domain-containing protein [Agriterribacter sp.]HRQ18725.1 DUF4129 domain-containing protein [Agriterribacter sp.]